MTIQSKRFERGRMLRETMRPGRLGIMIERRSDARDGTVRVAWYGALTSTTIKGALDSIQAAALLGNRILLDLRALDVVSSEGAEMLAGAFEGGHHISVLQTDEGLPGLSDLRKLSESLPVELAETSPHLPHPIHDAWAQFPPGDYFLG